ncbi:putative tRNA (cytidine(32)/guanosine(34)-2'-O)-methyltransferase [Paragonimus heterotremus]|uniref:Putative tRNA (cytidine(32)/guanosine(34)-2'-O)-methyltransferase n=1 Tax=Paragonimus heterotremus TaxID=100268 RepID=A0A8J4T891_9TREM|nr:putative tRNA (cytidine(32)/guanosine(34)-2'-O)-methyltransferase [Paragonimus heterotremus]
MGKSSRDKRDIYYRLAKEEGWRARSAYKLMQIDDEFGILNSTEDDPLERVVDLCAAPGSWSQVLSKRLWEPKPPEDRVKVKIVAVDLQAMAPIPGVVQIQGDITSSQTANQIIDCFCGKLAQLVVCDGAPDVGKLDVDCFCIPFSIIVTGLHDLDEYVQSHLILAALTICARILQRGGTFVAKVFRSRDAGLLGSQLRCLFDGPVTFAKPRSSRNSSLEAFVVCQGYSGPRMRSQLSAVVTEESKEQGNETQSTSSTNSNSKEDVQEVDPLLLQWYDPNNFEEISPDQKSLLPFVACGDLSGFDADLCYSLQADYVSLPPVQCPIDPAYSDVCRRARSTLNHKETQPETTEASKPSSLSPSQQTDSSSAVADYGIAELLRFLNVRED